MSTEIRTIPTGLTKLLLSDVPTTTSSKSAVLELQTNHGALLHARMNTADMNSIADPVIGMEIYNTAANQLYIYTNAGWTPLAAGGGSGNVTGPGSSVTNDIAVFADTSGTLLADSGIATGTVAVGPETPQFIKFTTASGVIFVDSDAPVYFTENGGKCSSVFTGGTPAEPSSVSALVELNSTTAGFVNARMSKAERDLLIPVNGMQIYDTTTGHLESYQSGAWVELGVGGGGGDVNGPGSSIANHIATFTDATGTLIQDSGALLTTSSTFEILEDANHLFIGSATGDLTSGITNLGIGGGALQSATGNSASENVAIGFSALSAVTTASGNVAVGNTAMAALTIGTNNVAVGIGALATGTTFGSCTAIGSGALQANNAGSNTAVGAGALGNNTTGGFNTAIGTGALQFNTTGGFNTAVGPGALESNTTGAECTAIGGDALASNTTGGFNTAVGVSALEANTTATECTAVGAGALAANTTGDANTGIGVNALVFNTTGTGNSGVGAHALEHNITGARCTAMGIDALNVSTASDDNSAFGYFAMRFATGTDCTAIGAQALLNETGDGNVAVGSGTGTTWKHTNCTMIGTDIEMSINDLTNVTLLGAGTTASTSNSVILGNSCRAAICESVPIPGSALSLGDEGIINGIAPRIYMHSTLVENISFTSTVTASGFYQVESTTAKPRFIGTPDGATLAESTGTIVTTNTSGGAATAGAATITLGNGETAPIATTAVHSSSIILVTQIGLAPAITPVAVDTIIDGTSFVIKASGIVGADTHYNWLIINP